MTRIKVAVVDDMESIREYYSTIFNNSKEFICCGTAKNEEEALSLIENKEPDVVLLDIQMEKYNSGLVLIPLILNIHPKTKIVVFTVHDDQENIYHALSLGAKNYCLKTASVQEIKDILLKCYNDINLINSEISHKLLSQIKNIESNQQSLFYLFTKFTTLSATEIDILRSLCMGKNYKTIAKERFVEEVTIRSNASRIMKKLEYKHIKTMIDNINELKLFSFLDSMSKN